MLNLKLTEDGEVIKGIFSYMRNEYELQADTEDEARAIMMTYLELFIEDYGVDRALEDGLLVPAETM
jgi:predicted RNase H-like HicB family nuclease